ASPAPASVPVSASTVVVPPRRPSVVACTAVASPTTVCAWPAAGRASSPAATRTTATRLQRKASVRRMLTSLIRIGFVPCSPHERHSGTFMQDKYAWSREGTIRKPGSREVEIPQGDVGEETTRCLVTGRHGFEKRHAVLAWDHRQ